MLSPSQTQKQQRIENLLSDGLSVETIAMMTGTSVRYVNHFVNSKNNTPMISIILNRKVYSVKISNKKPDDNYNFLAHLYRGNEKMPLAGTFFKKNTQSADVISWAKSTILKNGF